MAILSLGQPGLPVDYSFDQPFNVLSFGPGYWGGPGTLTDIGGNVLHGVEGHGVIQFQGMVSSITWTAAPSETWHGFQIGTVPDPASSLFLFGTAFGILAMARRRNK